MLISKPIFEYIPCNGEDRSLFRYTVMGNMVNMASRLLAFAKDSEVVISANVHNELASDEMKTLVGIATANIKCIETPQQIYRRSVLCCFH